jgi:hypothetical protein
MKTVEKEPNALPGTPEKKGKEVVKISHANIFEALSAFQGELTTIEQSKSVKFKTKDGREVDFKYAPLSEVMKVIYPILGRHGLSVRHEITKDGVDCVLSHETRTEDTDKIEEIETIQPDGTKEIRGVSKTFIQNELRSGVIMVSRSGDMKEIGGQITYARRYTLSLVLGIASEEDKDTEFEEQRKDNVEKFAMAQSRKGIDACKTPEDVAKSVAFFENDLKLIDAGKAPILGLTKENYAELKDLAVKKQVELHKNKAVGDTTIEPMNPNFG